MKKRLSLLLAALTLLLAACGTAAPAPTTQTTTPTTVETTTQAPSMRLTLACSQTEDSLLGRGAVAFCQELATRSGEQLTCTLLPGGSLGTDEQVIPMLQGGKCDLSLLPAASLTQLCPELEVLGLPFLFESDREARELLGGEAGTLLAERLASSGLRTLGWMTTGFRQVTANQAINTPADFQGLAIRTQPDELHRALFQALGATPTLVLEEELLEALEQGAVDGQEDTYLNISAKELSQVQSHVMETNHVLELALLVISDAQFQNLSQEQRTWLQEAAAQAENTQWAAAMEENDTAKQDCIEKGMISITLGRQALVDAAGPVYDQYREQYGKLMSLFNR